MSPCFKPFLIGNMSDKFLPTRTLLCVSVRHIFLSLTSFLGDPKLNENIIQDVPPKWIIICLEVYKQLMHCFIVVPFFLKYLTNAEYMTTKSNLYLANSVATVESEPDLYRLLTFQVPNLMSLFHYLGCTKGSVQQAQGNCTHFVTRPAFTVRNY